MKLKKIIEGVALVAALAVFGVAGYKLYAYMDEANKETAVVNALSQNAVRITQNSKSGTSGMTVNGTSNDDEYVDTVDIPSISLDVDFDYLISENEDIKAWIYCPDTVINYPIMQAQDNDYYLHRLVDGTYNSAGSLFMDCGNSGDFSDNVTVVYGHHMKNGSMFGSISSYKKQQYYEEHPLMYLATTQGSYTLKLIAGFSTNAYADIYSVPLTSDEKDDLLENAIKNSYFDSGISASDISETDRLVMLSTCSYEYENARFVLIGVLK